MKIKYTKFYTWVTIAKTLLQNNTIRKLLPVIIITITIPATLLALHTNTDNRQHAYYTISPSSGTINWCTGSNKNANPTIGLNFNGLGTCGTNGWGRCEPSKTACGNGTWDPQTNGGSCRSFDTLSGCCYPPQKIVNTSVACGVGGYGTCQEQPTCSSLNGGTHFLFFWNKNDNSCNVLGNKDHVEGCCYPRGLDYTSRQSDAVCKQSTPPSSTSNNTTNTTVNNSPVNNAANTSGNTNNVLTSPTNTSNATNTNTQPTIVPTNPIPIGSINSVSCGPNKVMGWACDASDYAQNLKVDLYLDGPEGKGTLLPNSPVANVTRELAVGTACGNDTNNVKHGFLYTLPPSLEDGKKHTLYAYGVDYPGGTNTNNTLLPNSPVTFTCFNPTTTTGNITLQFEGIGLSENPMPLHPTRQVILYFYPANDTTFSTTPYVSPPGTVLYNSTTGYFSNSSFSLKGLTSGKYLVLVHSLDGALVTQIGSGDGTGPIVIQTGIKNTLVDTQNSQDTNAATIVPFLKMGDIITSGASFNNVDTLDYSALTDCYGSTTDHLTDACLKRSNIINPTTRVLLSDLNDDGVVDGIDYTILQRNYGHYSIGGSSMNRRDDPTE